MQIALSPIELGSFLGNAEHALRLRRQRIRNGIGGGLQRSVKDDATERQRLRNEVKQRRLLQMPDGSSRSRFRISAHSRRKQPLRGIPLLA